MQFLRCLSCFFPACLSTFIRFVWQPFRKWRPRGWSRELGTTIISTPPPPTHKQTSMQLKKNEEENWQKENLRPAAKNIKLCTFIGFATFSFRFFVFSSPLLLRQFSSSGKIVRFLNLMKIFHLVDWHFVFFVVLLLPPPAKIVWWVQAKFPLRFGK